MNVGNWIYKRSLISPYKIAIISKDSKVSYDVLNKRINKLSHALLEMGIKKGDRIGVISRNCIKYLEAYYACSKMGYIFVPFNFRLAPPELGYQISDSGVMVLFGSGDMLATVKDCKPFLSTQMPRYVSWDMADCASVDDYESLIANYDDKEPSVEYGSVSLDTPQMIMYTSGTTGTPKGALMSHRKTLFNILNAQIFFDLYSNDVMLAVLPLFHSGGLNIMSVPTLYSGGTIILGDHFDPREFLSLIETHKVTQSMIVPTMLNQILKEAQPENHNLSSLRSLLIAGEPASAELVHKAQDRGLPVRQIFGQTETSIALWVPKEMSREKAGAVGIPVFHADVKIIDRKGKTLAPGEIGEIVIRGPIQMMSYYNRPRHEQSVDQNGWLHTNDLGKTDEDNYFYFVDRIGDMYISGGENVYPAEVEKILNTHPKVFEAAIVGVPDNRWGKIGHAFIKTRSEATISYDEVKAFLKKFVASYKIPKRIEMINDLPRTASGKIKKSVLIKQINRH